MSAICPAIHERREHPRSRCLLGGRAAGRGSPSTLDCVLRNHSAGGLLLTFTQAPMLPREIDVIVESIGVKTPAEIVWRDGDRLGVMFAAPGGLDAMREAAAARRRQGRAAQRAFETGVAEGY
jgi:hypothetical protein